MVAARATEPYRLQRARRGRGTYATPKPLFGARRRPALLGAPWASARPTSSSSRGSALEYRCFFYGFDLAWYGNLLASGGGRWPLYSTLHQSWFGDHFEPIGVFLVPVFRVFPTVWTLLLVQNLAFASVPLLCFLVAAELFADDRPALADPLLSVANPALWYINLDNFHWTVLTIRSPSPTFSLERGARRGPWVALGTMLLARKTRPCSSCRSVSRITRRSAACGPAARGGCRQMVLFLILNLWLMPRSAARPIVRGWGYSGSSVGEIGATLLTRPGIVGEQLFTRNQRGVPGRAAAAVLLCQLARLADLARGSGRDDVRLSTHLPRHTIASQSAAMVVACVIVSGLYGLRRLAGWLPGARRGASRDGAARRRARGGGGVLRATAAADRLSATLRGAAPRRPIAVDEPELCPERTQLAAILALVPADPKVAVVADGRLATRLVDHAWLQAYNWRAQPVSDYREFDLVVGSHRARAEAPRRPRKRRRLSPDARWAMLMTDPRWEQIYTDASGYFVCATATPSCGAAAARREG
jgi:hypothetical protein